MIDQRVGTHTSPIVIVSIRIGRKTTTIINDIKSQGTISWLFGYLVFARCHQLDAIMKIRQQIKSTPIVSQIDLNICIQLQHNNACIALLIITIHISGRLISFVLNSPRKVSLHLLVLFEMGIWLKMNLITAYLLLHE